MADKGRAEPKQSAFLPHGHKANTKHILWARSNDSEDRGTREGVGPDKS